MLCSRPLAAARPSYCHLSCTHYLPFGEWAKLVANGDLNAALQSAGLKADHPETGLPALADASAVQQGQPDPGVRTWPTREKKPTASVWLKCLPTSCGGRKRSGHSSISASAGI